MKSIVTVAFTAAFILGAGLAYANECTRSPVPTAPDGKVASRDDMVAAQAAVKNFLAEGEAFRNCLQAQEKLIPADQLTEELRKSYVDRYNASVDDEQRAGAEFNQAVRDYKAAQPQ